MNGPDRGSRCLGESRARRAVLTALSDYEVIRPTRGGYCFRRHEGHFL
jgi:hypothetical protein